MDVKPFLDAIAAAPGDRRPYLVFADWLEERGDDRGTVVRQVAGSREGRLGRFSWRADRFSRRDRGRGRTTHVVFWTVTDGQGRESRGEFPVRNDSDPGQHPAAAISVATLAVVAALFEMRVVGWPERVRVVEW